MHRPLEQPNRRPRARAGRRVRRPRAAPRRADAAIPPHDVAAALAGVAELNLTHNGLSWEAGQPLARGLLNRPNLSTLRLGRNGLGDAGVEALSQALIEGAG